MFQFIEEIILGEAMLWGRPLLRWYLAVIVFVLLLLGLFTIKIFGSRFYKKRKQDFEKEFHWPILIMFLLGKLNLPASLLVALYAASEAINPIARYERYFKIAFIFGVFAQIFIWANGAINMYSHQRLLNSFEKDPSSSTAINLFALIWKFLVFSLLFLIMLDLLGFNISTLLAGLGVGGIAVALAVQNILGDLFASLTIVFDKPFRVGDTIQIDAFTGTVENIGLKTTRLRSITGEQIIMSNNEVLKARLQNYTGIIERRIFFKLGVDYRTPYEKMMRISDIIEKAIMEQPKTRIDRVHFREYGESSLNFEVSYYIAEERLKDSCDVQQAVNLAILKSFEENGIDFAFPSRTIYLHKDSSV